MLGGRLHTTVTGSAPISPAAMDFLKIAVGGDLIEGMYNVFSFCFHSISPQLNVLCRVSKFRADGVCIPVVGSTECLLRHRYGMTENCGSCTRCWPGDPSSSGTVGAPNPVTEIKLVDVPSMGYSAEDKPEPRGEICFRGDHAFPGYYKGWLSMCWIIEDDILKLILLR